MFSASKFDWVAKVAHNLLISELSGFIKKTLLITIKLLEIFMIFYGSDAKTQTFTVENSLVSNNFI